MITLKHDEPIPADAKMIVRNAEGVHVYFTDDVEVQQQHDAMRARWAQETAASHRADNKQQRKQNINNITVTTLSGNTFDGDEISQQRMTRAIIAMDEVDTISWTLADNTIASVNREELREALRLAVLKQSQLWILTNEK